MRQAKLDSYLYYRERLLQSNLQDQNESDIQTYNKMIEEYKTVACYVDGDARLSQEYESLTEEQFTEFSQLQLDLIKLRLIDYTLDIVIREKSQSILYAQKEINYCEDHVRITGETLEHLEYSEKVVQQIATQLEKSLEVHKDRNYRKKNGVRYLEKKRIEEDLEFMQQFISEIKEIRQGYESDDNDKKNSLKEYQSSVEEVQKEIEEDRKV